MTTKALKELKLTISDRFLRGLKEPAYTLYDGAFNLLYIGFYEDAFAFFLHKEEWRILDYLLDRWPFTVKAYKALKSAYTREFKSKTVKSLSSPRGLHASYHMAVPFCFGEPAAFTPIFEKRGEPNEPSIDSLALHQVLESSLLKPPFDHPARTPVLLIQGSKEVHELLVRMFVEPNIPNFNLIWELYVKPRGLEEKLRPILYAETLHSGDKRLFSHFHVLYNYHWRTIKSVKLCGKYTATEMQKIIVGDKTI